jgi:hypothetical protein
MTFEVDIPIDEIRDVLSGYDDILEKLEIEPEDALEYAKEHMDTTDILDCVNMNEIKDYLYDKGMIPLSLDDMQPKEILKYLINRPNLGQDWIQDQLKMELSAEEAFDIARSRMSDDHILSRMDNQVIKDYLINAGFPVCKPVYLWFDENGLTNDLLSVLAGQTTTQAKIYIQMFEMLREGK